MAQISIQETFVNQSRGTKYYISDWYDTEYEVGEEGDLYRALLSEYGRCIGKVYIDLPGAAGVAAIGWVFLKKSQYEDTGEDYLQETWISMEHKYDEAQNKF